MLPIPKYSKSRALPWHGLTAILTVRPGWDAGWRRDVKRSGEPKRRRPLRPSVAQQARNRIKRVNAKRKAKRKAAGEVYGPYHEHVGTLPCLLARDSRHRCMGEVHGHHILSVGAGGRDAANEVPLCDGAHTLSSKAVHVLGAVSFVDYWRVNLVKAAERFWFEWLATEAGAVWLSLNSEAA